MIQLALLSSTVIIGLVVAILHYMATSFYLYWDLFWFDMLMHFLGGLWVGLVVLWFLKGARSPLLARFVSLSFVVFGVLVVGFLWELFEVVTKTTGTTKVNFWQDTSGDFFFDTLGAVAAWIYFIILRKFYE